MEITPKPSSASELQNISPTRVESSTVSSIDELSLEYEQVYKARVLRQLTSNETATKNDPTPETPNPKQNLAEWLLKINNKITKVVGNLPIQPGQTLHVKLEHPTNAKTNSLVIVQQTSHGEGAHTQSRTSGDINLMLKTLSKLLPKQLSIASGFHILNKLNNTEIAPQIKGSSQHTPANSLSATSNQASTTNHHTQATSSALPSTYSKSPQNIINHLIKTLPQAELISSSNTSHQEGKHAHLIQQAIKNSGLFFESTLSKPGEKEQLLSTLHNLRTQAGSTTLPSAQQIAQQTTHHNAQLTVDTKTQSDATKTSSNLTTSKQALDLLQRFVERHENSTAKSKNIDSSAPLDLKATLLGLSSLVSPPNTDKLKKTDLINSLLSQLVEPELLNTPFNFPRIQNESAAKAQALLADQEFSTGQLLKILAGMLNRIQFNQLNSLYQSQNNDGNILQSWFIELPVVNMQQSVNSFDIRIDKEKDPSKTKDEENDEHALQWKLALSFDLEELGAMYIQVSLLPPSISSIIWAEKDSTYQLAQSEIPQLKEKLSSIGLEPGDIICQKGLPPQRATKLTQSLVDVQA